MHSTEIQPETPAVLRLPPNDSWATRVRQRQGHPLAPGDPRTFYYSQKGKNGGPACRGEGLKESVTGGRCVMLGTAEPRRGWRGSPEGRLRPPITAPRETGRVADPRAHRTVSRRVRAGTLQRTLCAGSPAPPAPPAQDHGLHPHSEEGKRRPRVVWGSEQSPLGTLPRANRPSGVIPYTQLCTSLHLGLS